MAVADYSQDGLEHLHEIVFSIYELKQFIEGTTYANDSKALFASEDGKQPDIIKISQHFAKYFDEILTNTQLSELCAIACFIHSIDATAKNATTRNWLLSKAFFYKYDKSQMQIIVKTIWEAFKRKNDTKFALNILALCNHSITTNTSGLLLGISLAFALICEISETDIDNFGLQKFSSLIDMIHLIDDEMLALDSSLPNINILIHATGFLLNTIVISEPINLPTDIQEEYFQYTIDNLKSLKIWFENLFEILTKHRGKKYWDLRMIIIEYLSIGLLDTLSFKIQDMEDNERDLRLK